MVQSGVALVYVKHKIDPSSSEVYALPSTRRPGVGLGFSKYISPFLRRV
jgi:hypothetical protein